MRTHDHWMNAVSRRLLTVLLPLLCPITLFATDGHFLHGAGPVNEAMGGADTGICLDATGSIAWNPACTVLFKKHRLEFHLTIFAPWRSLSSTVEANAFGPGMPGATLSGTTESKRDMSFMPGLAFIYHPENSHNAYHFAMLAVSGFGVDYPENTDFSNPILTPQAPNGFGFGRIRSNYMLVTVPIGMSRQISDRFSAGISLVPAFSMLQVIPAPFYAPVTAGSTMPYYLSAGNQAPAFGFGVNAGLHYEINKVASVGFAYHSPIWFQDFKWNRKDLTGVSHEMTFQMNLPQVISMGVGLTPSKGTRIGVDARWFDYQNTAGFDKVGYDADGAVSGFGWRNIWAVGGGVQQQVTSSTKLMVGYNYSENPVPAQYTFFNTPAPAIVQHHLSGGIVQKVHGWDVNATYYHAFQNSITGPWISAQGPIPGTSVTSKMSENSFTIGMAKSF
ncbi:MAG: outer membrane protein transport protein [Terracidiphilus sp.]